MRELLRQVTEDKEAELVAARDAVATVKSEQDSQTASLQQAIRAEAEQHRCATTLYSPDATVGLGGCFLLTRQWLCIASGWPPGRLRCRGVGWKSSCGASRVRYQLHGPNLNSNKEQPGTNSRKSATGYTHSCRRKHTGGR